MRTLLILLALALTSCASVRPSIKCSLADGTAEVHQGVFGIGVGQALPDADVLCAGLVPL